MLRPTEKHDIVGHDPTDTRPYIPADESLKHFNGFVTQSLSQCTKQTKISHGGLPNGVNRCLKNLKLPTVRLSHGGRPLFKF